jgi:hypothetical protein
MSRASEPGGEYGAGGQDCVVAYFRLSGFEIVGCDIHRSIENRLGIG